VNLADATATLLRSLKFRQWGLPQESDIIISPEILMREPHYSPSQLAKLWGVSTETIRVIFRTEHGVLKLGKPATKYRRAYITLKIPESVAERVHERLSA
jgi:hypothetical protein